MRDRVARPWEMVAVEQAIIDVFGAYAGWAHNTLFIAELAHVRWGHRDVHVLLFPLCTSAVAMQGASKRVHSTFLNYYQPQFTLSQGKSDDTHDTPCQLGRHVLKWRRAWLTLTMCSALGLDERKSKLRKRHV
jgi:hypothetical protein